MSGESFQQIEIMMRMHQDNPQGRQRIAERLAGEFPAILQQYGEKRAGIVAEWLKKQGFRVSDDLPTGWRGWLEVVRLSWLLFRRVKWREVNPKEVLRVVVWWVMGWR